MFAIFILTLLLQSDIYSYSSEGNLGVSEVRSPVIGTPYPVDDHDPESRAASLSEPSRKCIWVFFTDKGTVQDGMNAAVYNYEAQLPPRVRKRRQKLQGCFMDSSDLPVFQPYIDEVLRTGAKFRIASRWLNGITVEVIEDLIPCISRLPFVRSVEPVITYRKVRPKARYVSPMAGDQEKLHPSYAPGDHLAGTDTGYSTYGLSSTQIRQIHADALHNKGYHGEGMIIAILDTGFDLSHQAFRNIRVLDQYDFVNNDCKTLDEPPEDDIGQDDHGTEVLSIIAGNSPGNLMGIAYAADYLLAKTEKMSHKGVMFEQRIEEDWWVAALEWAESNGADVVSSSLGYSDWYSYSDMDGKTARTTIAANIAVQKGILVVVSAGNEGKSRGWPYISAPADGFDVIAVGAVNSDGKMAEFSSVGPTYDGRIKPDLVAMGDDTYVVDPHSTDGYRRADGTSMATPLVAGTAALLLQALPDMDDPGELLKLLKYTATRATCPDNRYGWGIINAELALLYGTSPELMEEIKNWNPVNPGAEQQRVLVYPNPVRRNSSMCRLNIYSPEPMESISVYSMSGSLIYERQDMGSARLSIWDLGNQYGREVANGVYICVIKNLNGTATVKKIAVID